jgi:hypothetical protein
MTRVRRPRDSGGVTGSGARAASSSACGDGYTETCQVSDDRVVDLSKFDVKRSTTKLTIAEQAFVTSM